MAETSSKKVKQVKIFISYRREKGGIAYAYILKKNFPH